MDVVLGVAVTGPVARLALIAPGAQGDVVDQSVVDLADNPIETLTQTVVGTNRLLADENHHLVATRLCWTDHPRAERLRQALEDSGVHNVGVLSESQAVAALMRTAGRPGAALLFDGQTATLSMLGSGAGDPDAPPTMLASAPIAGDATEALDTLMARLVEQPGAPTDVYLVGTSADTTASDLTAIAQQLRGASTARVEIPDDPTFALARGAALAAGPDATMAAPALTGDETAFAPAAQPDAEEPQLAYSMAGDSELLPVEMDDGYGPLFGEFDEYEDEAETGRLSGRALLISNAVIAFAVIGFASLAVAVVMAIRPTASQAPVVGYQNAAPGKFMPLLPTQQQAPVPAPPPDQPNAGYQGGVIPDSNGYIPPQLVPPGATTPPVAPVNPNAPVPVPVPIPLPVPVPIPFPQPYPPYVPPTTTQPPTTTTQPPTTTTQPPTTTTQPPTTTTQPPTTTTQPPTTTTQPPTTTTQPPTTTTQPPTTTTQPPTTTEPPTTSKAPPTTSEAPTVPSTKETTQAPVPTHTQTQEPKPVTPQEPHGGHHAF